MADTGTGGGQGAPTNTGGTPSTQSGQGSGSGSYSVPATQGAATAAATSDSRREEAREQFQSIHVAKLVRRFGTVELALESLAGELFDIREEKRNAPPPPPAGSMVLVGADVQAWQQYQALGLPPDKVKEGLAERDALRAKDSAATQGTTNQQAVEAVGWKDAQALGELLTAKGLQLEMRDVQVQENGKTATKRVPYARKSGDDRATWEPLADVVNTHHKAWLPALNAGAQGGTSGTSTAPGSNGTQGGAAGARTGTQSTTQRTGAQGGAQTTSVVVSSGQQTSAESDAQGGGSLAARRLARNQQAANGASPLRPAKPTT